MSQEDQIQFKRRCYLFAHDPARTGDETTDALNIGVYIAAQRASRKLTQMQLAKRIGVNVRTVTRWEVGDTSPGLSQLPALAAALEPAGRGLLHDILAYQPPPERRS